MMHYRAAQCEAVLGSHTPPVLQKGLLSILEGFCQKTFQLNTLGVPERS